MRILCHGKLFICVALSFLFVFILASKTFATTETKLLASDGAESDWFGHAVSISGDVALVGAELDGDKGTDSAAAYVYKIVDTSPPNKAMPWIPLLLLDN